MFQNNNTLEASEKLISIVNKEKPFKISIEIIPVNTNSSGKNNFYIGDAVKIRFESEKDCYLTLVDIGTSGNAHIIVPSVFNIDNFVKANRAIFLPEGEHDVAAMVHGPVGIERIKAFATQKPLNLFDLDFNSISNTSLTFTSDKLEKKTEKIIEKLLKEPGDSWCDALCEFHIKSNGSIPPVM